MVQGNAQGRVSNVGLLGFCLLVQSTTGRWSMKFKRNLGMMDRVLRSGISAGMIYFGFFSTYLVTDHLAGMVLGVVGVANLAMAVVGYCPFYDMIGFSTAQHKAGATT
jgi:hypothetical protein